MLNFSNMRLRKRFTVIMLIVYLASLPVITGISYFVLMHNAKREVLDEANLMLAAMESARAYTSEVLRPVLTKLLPDKFVIEGMSATKVAYEIQKRIGKKLAELNAEEHADYSFKEATENPLNLINKADEFELQKIREFRTGKLKTEWRGYKKTSNGDYYVIMRPVVVKEGCLKCHGAPDMAPPEVREKYGTTHGYNWKIGDIVAVNSVYTPVEDAKEDALRALLSFTGIYSTVFLLIIIVIDRLIIKTIISPIERFAKTADEVSRGYLDREFHVETNDEIKLLADAFNRMKVSLKKAMSILPRQL